MRPFILDISRRLGSDTPTYPGDANLRITWTTAHGDGPAAVSAVTLSPHLGTHVDAPLHLKAGAADAAALPLSVFVGPCRVVDVSAAGRAITAGAVPDLREPISTRILLQTGAWPPGTSLPDRHPAPTPELIDHLADCGVVLLGVDTPSVDSPCNEDLPVHRRCVARGLAILEGLDLASAAPGSYTLVAAPLPLAGVEASPVRAFLLPAGALLSE